MSQRPSEALPASGILRTELWHEALHAARRLGFFGCAGCMSAVPSRAVAPEPPLDTGSFVPATDLQIPVPATGHKYCSRTMFSSNGLGIGLATDPR
jgi:hypothetical protein